MTISVSYASGPSDKPLLGTTIPEFFDNIVHKYGGRDAVVSLHQDLRFTYKELAEQVNVLAKAFLAAGFSKGDRVGVWSPNNIEWLTTQYASSKAGIILVTINPAYRVHELAYVLEQSGC
ncbi:MAG: AMP-binding protein, partial [Pseudohongiellaceae bacterium]